MARTVRGDRTRNGILREVARMWQAESRPPIIREIGKAAGLSSLATVVYHLRVLQADGLLDYAPWNTRAGIVLTPAGWEAMGCRVCECCGGTGRVSNG